MAGGAGSVSSVAQVVAAGAGVSEKEDNPNHGFRQRVLCKPRVLKSVQVESRASVRSSTGGWRQVPFSSEEWKAWWQVPSSADMLISARFVLQKRAEKRVC